MADVPPACVVLWIFDKIHPERHCEALRTEGIMVGDLYKIIAVESRGAAVRTDARSRGNAVFGMVTLAAGVEGFIVVKGPPAQ